MGAEAPKVSNELPSEDGSSARRADGSPRVFGDYVFLERLAQGGMGDVYLAKTAGGAMGIERACVVKALRPELTADQHYVARFIDEARLVVKLQHPNICHVFDVGRCDGQYYLAMEYIEGYTLGPVLAQLAERRLPTPGDVLVHIAAEILAALDYAHSLTDGSGRPLDLVHRDVSLHNVMVGVDGSVKLVDFGIASSRLKMERTAPQVVLGKLAYMSPEQARGEDVDGRTDQFATGVMLYEMVVGERYYHGLSTEEIWQVVGRGGFKPRLWNALPADLQGVLSTALAADAGARFPTAGVFEDALRSLLLERGKVIGPPQVREVLAQLAAERDDHTEMLDRSVAEVTQGAPPAPAAAVQHFAQSAPTLTAAAASSASLPAVSGPGASSEAPADDELLALPTEQFVAPPSQEGRAQPGAGTAVAAVAAHPAGATEVVSREQAALALRAAAAARVQEEARADRSKLLVVGSVLALALLVALFAAAAWLKRGVEDDTAVEGAAAPAESLPPS